MWVMTRLMLSSASQAHIKAFKTRLTFDKLYDRKNALICGASACDGITKWTKSSSEYIRFFQSLLREHILFQPGVEANVFERQDRLRAFGGCAHLYPLCDPDAGDFFEITGFQNPLFLALFVVHLGQHGVRRIFRDPDVDVSVLGFVGRHGARLDLVGLTPVNHFALTNELVGEIVEHALRQVLVGEIRAEEALSAFLSGEAADASNRGRVHPLTVSHAALVDRKQTDAANLRRVGKSHKSLAIAQLAEF